MSIRTPLGRVRGLGSAKEGVQHWWMQRLTALALVPLSLWFIFTMVAHAGYDHGQIVGWLGHPSNAVLLILLLAATFHHAQLGLQVVIEDYVHGDGAKLFWLLLVKAAAIVLGLAVVFAVFRMYSWGS